MLPPAIISAVMKYLTDINPDWSGGLIYFPSGEPTTGYLTKSERALKRAQAVVFTEDGFSVTEISSTLNVSKQTIRIWNEKYGAEIRSALATIREENQNG